MVASHKSPRASSAIFQMKSLASPALSSRAVGAELRRGLGGRIGAMVGLDLPVTGTVQQVIVTEPAPRLVDNLVALSRRHLSLKQQESGGLLIGGGWFGSFDSTDGRSRNVRRNIEGNLWVGGRGAARRCAGCRSSVAGEGSRRRWTGCRSWARRLGCRGSTMRCAGWRIRWGRSAESWRPTRCCTGQGRNPRFTLERFG